MNIGFVAHKYMPKGLDKGYDLFIESARILCSKRSDIFFHIIGPYDENDIDISDFSSQIKFHGSLIPDKIDEIHQFLDLIISPNKPFILT